MLPGCNLAPSYYKHCKDEWNECAITEFEKHGAYNNKRPMTELSSWGDGSEFNGKMTFYKICKAYIETKRYAAAENCIANYEDYISTFIKNPKVDDYYIEKLPQYLKKNKGQLALAYNDFKSALEYFKDFEDLYSVKYSAISATITKNNALYNEKLAIMEERWKNIEPDSVYFFNEHKHALIDSSSGT